jgi:glycosyltransferase involved in cell wall biosynthesis
MRILVATYAFPPTGGAGVQRTVKLVKYLGALGARVSVLTVSNPSVPVRDESLLKDVPGDVEVIRVPTLEPGYATKQKAATPPGAAGAGPLRPGGPRSLVDRLRQLALDGGRQAMIPDPQILWQPAAQLALGRRLVGGRDDLVFISGPPFSQFLLGPLVRLRPGTALVLDYRDEWSTVRDTYENRASLPARVGGWMERHLVGRAHAITTATGAFRENLLVRFPRLGAERVTEIPNGYDPDDFPTELPGPPEGGDKLVITYAGTAFRLTSPAGLLAAVRLVHAQRPQLGRHLRIRFVGRIVEGERAAFEGMEALGVEQVGYVPHEQVAGILSSSHLALCILDEAPGVENIYPAKVFELMYLAAQHRLSLLTLCPPGVLADLVRDHRLGPCLPPRDPQAIADFLIETLGAFVEGRPPAPPAPVEIARFHRRHLAQRFLRVFEQAVERART